MDKENMEEHELMEKDGTIIEKDLIRKCVNNKLQDQRSLQHNKQDLEQTQEVDVKPNQFSLQHIDLTINNRIENYSGRIVGTIYAEEQGIPLSNSQILLFFGSGTDFPVMAVNSDANGNFVIEDLPPGFYTIKANLGYLQCLTRNIKILPGETCHQTLSLSPRPNIYY